MALGSTTRAQAAATALDIANQVVEHLERLAAAADLYERDREREQLRYVQLAGRVPAGGTVLELAAEVPAGSFWIIERVVTTCGAGDFALFLDGTDAINLIDYVDPADHEAREAVLHAPERSKLTARFAGQMAGDACTVNLRVRELAVGE